MQYKALAVGSLAHTVLRATVEHAENALLVMPAPPATAGLGCGSRTVSVAAGSVLSVVTTQVSAVTQFR